MLPKWEQYDREIHSDKEYPDLATGHETVHMLRLENPRSFMYLNAQVTRGGDAIPEMNLSEYWHISAGGCFKETFRGSLEDAKQHAIDHLYKHVEEARGLLWLIMKN